jgi:flagellum-specific ATP synthase
MLDRRLAAQGHYPPIAILDSISRLMPAICNAAHLEKSQRLRSFLSSYAASEDLIRVGAYHKGGDATLDQALGALPALTAFLRQKKTDLAPLDGTIQALMALPG